VSGIPTYPGVVVGQYRTVNGQTFITESGARVYYSVSGVTPTESLAQVLFASGAITPVPNTHTIVATKLLSLRADTSITCDGTLAKREGRYFVDSPGDECGTVELIEGDAASLDERIGQPYGLTIRYCTVTKEGAIVAATATADFACTGGYP
jgi:hypothetical protein